LLCLHSLSVAACSKVLVDGGGKIDEIAENQEYTVIPLEEALSTLEDFLNDGQPTKASAISRGDYEVSRFAFNVDTKALNSLSSVPSGDILYCVNFKNDGGSAVLAANTIVKDPIVCVTEKGSITADDITKSSNRLLDMPYMEKTDFIIP